MQSLKNINNSHKQQSILNFSNCVSQPYVFCTLLDIQTPPDINDNSTCLIDQSEPISRDTLKQIDSSKLFHNGGNFHTANCGVESLAPCGDVDLITSHQLL